MDFATLREKDKYGAFNEFITVAEAKRNKIISPAYWEYFSDTCLCGSERIITLNRKRMMCCDPRCYIKVYMSLLEVMNRFSCKHVGEQTCKAIVLYAQPFMRYNSHVEILSMDDKHLFPETGTSRVVNFNMARQKIKSTKMNFSTMVSKLAIPEFDNMALSVLDGVANFADLTNKIKAAGGIQPFLHERGAYSASKAFYFDEFLIDIAIAEHKVFNGSLRVPGKMKIQICITGELHLEGLRVTKKQFVDLCQEIGAVRPGFQLFDIEHNTAIKTTDYLIADYPSTTEKYLTVKARENDALALYHRRVENAKASGIDPGEIERPQKLIFTGSEFIEYLKGVRACVTDNKPIPNPTL